MSDFLQFVDRVPTLPNRKKITHADSSVEYATIEYADEPVETGTPLNKFYFDKINTRLGFNEVLGIYNPTTTTAEFTLEGFDESSLVNNQLIDIQCKSEVQGPADNFNVIKSGVSPNVHSYTKIIELDNGNIMNIGTDFTTCYISILDQNGNTIKGSTSVGTINQDIQCVKLDNGNIMISGYDSGASNTNIIIIDQSGNIVKSSTRIASYFSNTKMYKLQNGNILLYTNPGNTYLVVDQNGNIVKNVTAIHTGEAKVESVIQLTSGVIFFIGGVNSRVWLGKADSNGNVIQQQSSIGYYYINNCSAIELNNGNIMVVGCYQSSPYNGIALILDSNGNVLSSNIDFGGSFRSIYLKELSNGNIMVIGMNCYIAILDQSGNVVKTGTLIGNNMNYPYFIEMSNGSIISFGRDSGNTLYSVILDINGTIKKSETIVTDHMDNNNALEMSNGNIFVTGSYNDVSYMAIIQPFSSNLIATLNGITLDTFLVKDKYYELLYNETLDEFICEEVRNDN